MAIRNFTGKPITCFSLDGGDDFILPPWGPEDEIPPPEEGVWLIVSHTIGGRPDALTPNEFFGLPWDSHGNPDAVWGERFSPVR